MPDPLRMMVLKSKAFTRFAKRCGISDSDLMEAVSRAEAGLIDANLGGNVIKQRIAREGSGKSGGFRTIVLFRSGERAVFVHGFEKSAQANIDAKELKAFKQAARIVLGLNASQMAAAIASGAFNRVVKGSGE